ncbi:MAG: LysR family transcriptional regulator [Xanthomonadaceae bacterium]|nr:LysR family transcriptional regulator [Xanthomonadaceae bacterium]
MDWINYHHLFYFWMIVKEGSVTGASKKLRLSQSTLSEQLKILEQRIGEPLFDRVKKNLILNQTGSITFEYCEQIFKSGQELFSHLKNRETPQKRKIIRIGSQVSLSKNLQFQFLKQSLNDKSVSVRVLQGSLSDLALMLETYQVDLVLTDTQLIHNQKIQLQTQELLVAPICVVGAKNLVKKIDKKNIKTINGIPLFLPTYSHRTRSQIDYLIESESIKPNIIGEIEDPALMRFFAISGKGLAFVPEIVVQNEIQSKELEICFKLDRVNEIFYVTTLKRSKPDPLIKGLIQSFLNHR